MWHCATRRIVNDAVCVVLYIWDVGPWGDEKKVARVYEVLCMIIIYSNIIVINTFICVVLSCLILRCSAEHLQGFATTDIPSLPVYHGRGGCDGDTRFSTTGNDGILLSTLVHSSVLRPLQQLPLTGPRYNPNASAYKLRLMICLLSGKRRAMGTKNCRRGVLTVPIADRSCRWCSNSWTAFTAP